MALPYSRKPAAALVLAAAVVVFPAADGCAWLRWRSLALTHVDLIERLALDGAEGLAAPDGGLEPADIERLRYPLQRARAFADSSRRRFQGAPWVEDFDALLSAYADLVTYLDRARTAAVGPSESNRALELAARVSATAARVRENLNRDE